MATDKYPKKTTVRLTEGEHRAFKGAADQREMSLSRWLAMAGDLMEGRDADEYIKAQQDLERGQPEQARREAKELEELHRQMKRASHTLQSLLEEMRYGDGAPAEALEEAARKIDQATDAVLKKIL